MGALDSSYALWITPGDTTRGPFERLIGALSQRYQGPVFSPHITIASGLPSLGLARQLARECKLEILDHRLARLSFVFEDVGGFAEEPFRVLFLKPPRLHWLLLAEARTRKRGGAEVTEYLPHLSLFYGRLSLRQRRAATLAVEAARPLPFKAEKVEVWQVTAKLDQVPSWRSVEEIPIFDG